MASTSLPTPDELTEHRATRLLAVADATVAVSREETPEATLAAILREAARAMPSAQAVSVTVTPSRGSATVLASGAAAKECARLQDQLAEGPAADVLAVGAPVLVADLAAESRWPRFAAQAARAGVRSMVVAPLSAGRSAKAVLAAVSTAADAFDDDDLVVFSTLATLVGLIWAHAELATNLRTGLRTREEIGRAVGMLMERHRLTAPAAFDMLVLASQHSHRKLRDVAAWMTETGEDPTALIRDRRTG